jgi:hypothetical protein
MSRLWIQQRARIYLGGEGQSEQSYAARLGQIADSAGLHLYIDNDVLKPGGGDPLALVQLAIRRIKRKESMRGIFALRAILLDRDRWGATPERDAQIGQLSQRHRLHLIWQEPCHEGFLLRHLEGHQTVRPATSGQAEQALKGVWAEYQKAMPAIQLASRIDLAAVRRASLVEAALAAFLDQIGLTSRW